MTDSEPGSAARRCSSCGRVRAECRTPDQPFLSCCNDCAANDGDTHSAPKGEVCTGPCDHDKHERRGPTWFGWYEPATAARRGSVAYEPCFQDGHSHDWRDCPTPMLAAPADVADLDATREVEGD